MKDKFSNNQYLLKNNFINSDKKIKTNNETENNFAYQLKINERLR